MTDTTPIQRVGPDRMSRRTFLSWLAGIAAVALVVRVVFVLVRQSSVVLVTGDAYWYHFQAKLVADGRGFSTPSTTSWTVWSPRVPTTRRDSC